MIGLEFLQKIGEILQKSLSSEETYSAVFDILDGVIEFDSATLFVAQPATGALEMAETRGSQVVDLVSDVAFRRGDGLSGWVASQRADGCQPLFFHQGAQPGAQGTRLLSDGKQSRP